MSPTRTTKASAKTDAKVGAQGASRSTAGYDARRDEIIDLAAKLFAANGYTATGIAELGDAAQLGRGALYYYIGSKETLLGEIHDRVMDPLLSRAQAAAAEEGTPEERIRAISHILLDLILTMRDHVWVFLHEYGALTGENRATFQQKRRTFEELLEGLLEEGVRNGDFVISDVHNALLAFLGMHNYTYQWAHDGIEGGSEKLSNLYCDLFFNGIRSTTKR